MTKTFFWLRASAAAALALAGSSCYYDAYAGGYGGGYAPSYGGGGYYGGGYGDGGYVDASFASGGTSFVFTSSDQWFYDPVVFCYYDRYRSCYYDPFLGGYYPRGYCPRPIYGCPYPGGWRPGHGVCPPPNNFRDRFLSNYRDRVDQLRERNYAWASSVRERNEANVAAWQTRRAEAAQNFQANRAALQDRNQANWAQARERNQENLQAWRDRFPGNQAGSAQARLQQNQAALRERQQNWTNQIQSRQSRPSASSVVQGDYQRQHLSIPQQASPSRIAYGNMYGGAGNRPQFEPGARASQVSRPQYNSPSRPQFSSGSRPQVSQPQMARPVAPSGPVSGGYNHPSTPGGGNRDRR